MPDVTLKFKGQTILEMNASGRKKLDTKQQYCDDDIVVEYADPEKPTQSKTITPTAAGLTVTPDTGKVLSSVVVNGDADLVPANVRDGVNIFGVTGTMKAKEAVSWHQCPEAVRNYLANVTYDPSDYSTSQIANYAPATAVVSNTKPIGETVDGVTYYNEVPNKNTPFSSANVAGTVTPLDRLRWINTVTSNVRDLGGWPCDGGTVKYGMLVRGGEANAADKDIMVNQVGIKHELNLRGDEVISRDYSVWGVAYTQPPRYAWYSISDTDLWKQILRCVFDSINHDSPLYFHCAGGADRTGTLACVLEALLGLSQSDIDKDYELTSFFSGTGTDASARRRNETEWTGLINAIKAVPLVGGLTDTFRNRAVSFVLSLGFTIDEINAFRNAMIDGTPTAISVTIPSYTVTRNIDTAKVDVSNASNSINGYQDYACELRARYGTTIRAITVTMGGIDITSSCWYGTSGFLPRTVAKTLNDSTINNSKTIVIDGEGYGATVEPDANNAITSITVTMGGVDVTSSVVTLLE